jgi:flagellar basal-body rod protein FlgB
MPLFDSTIRALDAALGAASMKQQTIANNLANVNTPGYQRKDVQFDGMLREALAADESGEAVDWAGLTPNVSTDDRAAMRQDGNSVDIDQEMAHLAENNVRYNALVQMAAKKIQTLEYVISDGRR